jgi:hypothetical protein
MVVFAPAKTPKIIMRVLLLLLAAVLPASAVFVCPTSNPAVTNCYCSNSCSVGGDTAFPWTPTAFPVPSVNLGADTMCVTVNVPCVANSTAYQSLVQWLGVSGNVLYSSNARCASVGPQVGPAHTQTMSVAVRACSLLSPQSTCDCKDGGGNNRLHKADSSHFAPPQREHRGLFHEHSRTAGDQFHTGGVRHFCELVQRASFILHRGGSICEGVHV